MFSRGLFQLQWLGKSVNLLFSQGVSGYCVRLGHGKLWLNSRLSLRPPVQLWLSLSFLSSHRLVADTRSAWATKRLSYHSQEAGSKYLSLRHLTPWKTGYRTFRKPHNVHTPSLDTSNRDSLFQEVWRILWQKDSDLDIWKITGVKIKLFIDYGALLLQNAVTSTEHVVTLSLT